MAALPLRGAPLSSSPPSLLHPASGASTRSRLRFALAGRIGGSLLAFVVKVVTLPIILSAVGNRDYGNWVIALQAASYLSLVRLGFPAAQARFLSVSSAAALSGRPESREASSVRAPDGAAGHLASFLALNLFLGALSLLFAGAIHLLLSLLPGLSEAAGPFLWLGLFASAALPSVTFAAFLQSRLLEGWCEAAAMLATLAQAAATVLLLWSGLGLEGLVMAQGVHTLVLVLVLLAAYRGAGGPLRLRFGDARLATVKSIVPYAASMGLNLASVLVFTATDGLIIGVARGSEEVTRYDLAGKLVLMAFPLIFAGADVLFPWIARSSGSLSSLRPQYRRVLEGTLWIAGWIAAIYFFFGTPILRAWTGRADVSVPRSLAALFGAYFLCHSVTHVGAVFLQATGEVRTLSRLSAAAALLNLVLSVALVGPWGLEGVILASLIATLFGNGHYIPLHLKRKMGIPAREYLGLGLRHVALPLALVGGLALLVDTGSWSRLEVLGSAAALTILYAAGSWWALGRRGRAALRGREGP